MLASLPESLHGVGKYYGSLKPPYWRGLRDKSSTKVGVIPQTYTSASNLSIFEAENRGNRVRQRDIEGARRIVFILLNQLAAKSPGEIFEHSQLFGGTWPGAYPALCFSCGYFAYDQWDMLQYHLYSGWIPSILVHHLLLLVCFTLALYRNVTINYLILTLICELHSIFLHVRKVRRMAGVRDAKSNIVKMEWVLSWVTFFLARLGSHILITIKLIRDANKFGKGVELPLALLGMTGMNLLNVFLGLDLLKAYNREKKKE
ncbi:TRAM/LAG1/CLN8 homology domain [Macleaya cordata]|uniref:TRAM/LAG1/CLN8 homology domain n=1 Tax=Macleaya cordata TaxID=56857 RepID=A0A200R6W4_MACCD|nr:TRAM/LAG1/CLN8 homology domain [Macleaya cordata]